MGDDTYTHGHHESVLSSHIWRTAENSAAYLLPHLRPGLEVLDIGCGPGTITLGLAERVAPGRVVGVDQAAEVITRAAESAEATEFPQVDGGARADIVFSTGDVYALDFADASFDVVHGHQLLQHLSDPVAALREMTRVLRSDGVLAVRDSDYAAFAWAPLDPLLDRWLELYHQVTRHNQAEPDAGRHLLGWAQQAGLRDIRASSSTWTFADPDSRAWWGGLWAERVQRSAFAEQAVAYGFSDPAELEAISGAWLGWATADDGWFAVLHGEILARR
jgi:ubiquinone/menaquinone biosynthesis C-methylase UbiE